MIIDLSGKTAIVTGSTGGIGLAIAKGMRDKGWGRIQFISSESALNIPTEMVHYGVSKTALQGPTRTEGAIQMMADLAAERGVPVDGMEALFLKENRPSTLLHRFATPGEVANLSVYAASPQASATTGASLRVEGGIVESIV